MIEVKPSGLVKTQRRYGPIISRMPEVDWAFAVWAASSVTVLKPMHATIAANASRRMEHFMIPPFLIWPGLARFDRTDGDCLGGEGFEPRFDCNNELIYSHIGISFRKGNKNPTPSAAGTMKFSGDEGVVSSTGGCKQCGPNLWIILCIKRSGKRRKQE